MSACFSGVMGLQLRQCAWLMSGLTLLAAGVRAGDWCDEEVPVITTGTASNTRTPTAPSDAVVLFDGRDLSQWVGHDGPAHWNVHDGVVTVKSGTGDIETKRQFRDFQLHVEWREPPDVIGEGQARGNSGVFLQGRYEIQVLDSYHNRTYANGQAGALYGQSEPLVNAMRPPGQWNVYDIIFTAPRFNDDGALFSKARVTVLHNGVIVQNNTEIQGKTDAFGKTGYYDNHDHGTIRLQDHGDPGPSVSYRNIWVRELNSARAATTTDSLQPRASQSAVDSVPLQKLFDDPATRDVLSRCVPELLPDSGAIAEWGKLTLSEVGRFDTSLTPEKLRVIGAQLARAHSESGIQSKP
jgi:hypothetical protein